MGWAQKGSNPDSFPSVPVRTAIQPLIVVASEYGTPKFTSQMNFAQGKSLKRTFYLFTAGYEELSKLPGKKLQQES